MRLSAVGAVDAVKDMLGRHRWLLKSQSLEVAGTPVLLHSPLVLVLNEGLKLVEVLRKLLDVVEVSDPRLVLADGDKLKNVGFNQFVVVELQSLAQTHLSLVVNLRLFDGLIPA